MKIQIENLRVQMRGVQLNSYQRALALDEYYKLLDYVEELEQLTISAVSGNFSEEDMIKAFNAGGKHIYVCEANGKGKKCYCKNDNDCNQRHYISAEEWLKNYR